MKKIRVCAAPGRTVPLPAAVKRAPTGAQVVLLAQAPEGREPYPHELIGEQELELATAEAVTYVRRRIRAGDLLEVKPKAAAATGRKE